MSAQQRRLWECQQMEKSVLVDENVRRVARDSCGNSCGNCLTNNIWRSNLLDTPLQIVIEKASLSSFIVKVHFIYLYLVYFHHIILVNEWMNKFKWTKNQKKKKIQPSPFLQYFFLKATTFIFLVSSHL